jgi:hypothetical protein
MYYYECASCNYRARRNSDMVRHLSRKVKCPKNIDSYKYNDEEIHNMSLQLKKNNDILDNYKLECSNCKKLFSRSDNLKKHMKNYCKERNNEEGKSLYIENHIIENTLQSHIENQTNNIIIINPSEINLSSFDNAWNIEHIDKYIKQIILLSENKYTNLLDEILKNKENLNVILEKDAQYGLVYKNENDLYVNMKVREIVEKSMIKLHEQLDGFYSSLVSSDILKINENIINNEKKKIDNKFEDFCNNENIKVIVENLLENIYAKNKVEAIEMAEKVLKYQANIDNTIGY